MQPDTTSLHMQRSPPSALTRTRTDQKYRWFVFVTVEILYELSCRISDLDLGRNYKRLEGKNTVRRVLLLRILSVILYYSPTLVWTNPVLEKAQDRALVTHECVTRTSRTELPASIAV